MGAFLYFLIAFLSVYGAFAVFKSISISIWNRYKEGIKDIKLVLLVKNQECLVEYLVRGYFSTGFMGEVICDNDIVVLDMGSTDSTLMILKKLKSIYRNVTIMTLDERESVFAPFKEDNINNA